MKITIEKNNKLSFDIQGLLDEEDVDMYMDREYPEVSENLRMIIEIFQKHSPLSDLQIWDYNDAKVYGVDPAAKDSIIADLIEKFEYIEVEDWLDDRLSRIIDGYQNSPELSIKMLDDLTELNQLNLDKRDYSNLIDSPKLTMLLIQKGFDLDLENSNGVSFNSWVEVLKMVVKEPKFFDNVKEIRDFKTTLDRGPKIEKILKAIKNNKS